MAHRAWWKIEAGRSGLPVIYGRVTVDAPLTTAPCRDSKIGNSARCERDVMAAIGPFDRHTVVDRKSVV